VQITKTNILQLNVFPANFSSMHLVNSFYNCQHIYPEICEIKNYGVGSRPALVAQQANSWLSCSVGLVGFIDGVGLTSVAGMSSQVSACYEIKFSGRYKRVHLSSS